MTAKEDTEKAETEGQHSSGEAATFDGDAEDRDSLYEAQLAMYTSNSDLIETMEQQLEALEGGTMKQGDVQSALDLNEQLMATIREKQMEVDKAAVCNGQKQAQAPKTSD